MHNSDFWNILCVKYNLFGDVIFHKIYKFATSTNACSEGEAHLHFINVENTL